MFLAALRDAINLLATRPVLWLTGVACGLFCSLLALTAYFTGMFFATRFLILILLAGVFLAGMHYMAIKGDNPSIVAAVRGGAAYYFRILTPALVITFAVMMVFLLLMLTLSIFGSQDTAVLSVISFGVILPAVLLTFFADCAAVFEEKKVFASIQRSVEVATLNLFEVLLFYLTSFLLFCAVSFAFFVVWTAALADKLEPVTRFNETQFAAFTPTQLISLVGADGVLIGAVCVFLATTVLFPLLFTYKACFFRIVSGTTIPIRQVTGEFDSKGRWYKY